MDVMMLATGLNWIGKLIYDNLYGWVQTWGNDFSLIGGFGVTVILFTVFLKIATSPLDIWQKVLARKNSKKMEAMKPELDKITKQCGSNREMLMMKQREVYKKYKYSMFGACLPTIVTLVVFFVIFSGFNSAVRYHNSKVYDDLREVYHTAYQAKADEIKGQGLTESESYKQSIEAAEQAVLAAYKPERFLLTKNIFMPDTWKSPIPGVNEFIGTGIGKLGITDGVDKDEYEQVMKPIVEHYNYTESRKKQWNGYLILPIVALALSILSSKLVRPPEQPAVAGQTEEQAKMQKSQAKMMMFVMPIMMGVFALFYSTAFALYMVVSNIITTAFNLTFNLVSKAVDAKEKDKYLSTTIKK